METLEAIVREEIQWYAGDGVGANMLLFTIFDDKRLVYAVTSVDYPKRKSQAGVVVLARIWGDIVIIEEDATDRPLLDALLQRGVAREQIVLAYAGEPIPDAAQYEL
jgi:hypothetical protein